MPQLLRLCSKLYLSVPAHLRCKGLENLKKEEPEFEVDELCTYVGKKKNKVWIELVMYVQPAKWSLSVSGTEA
jgi:hypothetical protein